VHASDIAILGIHRKPPMIDHKRITGVCELPLAIASCPLGAVKPAKATVDGEEIKSVSVTVERCMFCGNCYTMCPAMPMADPEGDESQFWSAERYPIPVLHQNSPNSLFRSCRITPLVGQRPLLQ
jgi:dissimilatory sulfite reductase (desulfoviridin) alpha/beta subunit